MKPLDLEPIKARAEAATPEPWMHNTGGSVFAPPHRISAGIKVLLHTDREDADADCEFIAHSREDIPALIAEVEQLQAEITRLRIVLAERTP